MEILKLNEIMEIDGFFKIFKLIMKNGNLNGNS
jgi:hypothetical protein